LEKRRSLFLFVLVLGLGLVFSGCGLFQDSVDPDMDIEELSVADTLNAFIGDYNSLVDAYVEQFINFLEDDQVDESDPAVYDLDEEFTAVLAHYDELVMGGVVVDEETFKEMFIQYILWDYEGWEIEYNNVVAIDYKYRYFIELTPETWGGIFPFDYSQKPLRGFQAMVERTLTFGEQVTDQENNESERKYLDPISFALVEYEDGFKVFYFLPFMKK